MRERMGVSAGDACHSLWSVDRARDGAESIAEELAAPVSAGRALKTVAVEETDARCRAQQMPDT